MHGAPDPLGPPAINITQIIKPTTPLGRRREKGAVHWSHPAYANRHLITRNDEQIVRYNLALQ